MKNYLIRLFLLVAVLTFSGCGGDDDDDNNDMGASVQPDLPPLSTMVMDFRDFSDDAISPEGGRVMAKANWGWAALNAGIWNAIITINLVTPVAAFRGTINEPPTLDLTEGKWVWTKNFEVFGIPHSSRLTGQIVGSQVNWEMFISKEGEFQNYLWYSGQSNLLNTEGSWSLNFNPDDPTPFIDIEWSRSVDNSEANIRYTNLLEGENDGAYILYGLTADSELNRFYEIFQKAESNTIEISWNFETKAGRVKDPNHFSDNTYHCWDEDFEDIDCF